MCRLNRFDVQSRLELGNLNLITDRTREAIELFRAAMAIAPKDADPPRALAIALMKAGDPTEALRVLNTALRERDEKQRWQLHLARCRLLTELGDKSDDSDLYQETCKDAAMAIQLKPEDPTVYFHAGVVRAKLEDHRKAMNNFRACLDRDPTHFDADQNLRRVKSALWRERVQTRGGLSVGTLLGSACLIILAAMWYLYFRSDKITGTMVTTLSPILLGLVFVAFLLPWLSRLKLPGMEAELSKPAEKVSTGPTGSVGFGSSSIAAKSS